MIARVKFNETYAWDVERFAALRSILTDFPVLDEANGMALWSLRSKADDVLVDLLDHGQQLLAAGFQYTVLSFKSNLFTSLEQQLSEVKSSIKVIQSTMHHPEYGKYAQIMVPN